jgi:hypothetical protein
MFGAAPPVAMQQSADDQSDVIEVIGRRADQTLKIDRRTYQVQQSPHSQQKDAIQLLRRASCRDGFARRSDQPSRQQQRQDLRRRAGHIRETRRSCCADVGRIEVITNPSAQYSSEGTGGIINFVLRKKQGHGLSGNVSGEVSRPRGGTVNGTVKYKAGKWTYELSAGAETRVSQSSYRKRRSVEQTPGGAATINTEDGRAPSRSRGGFASGKVNFDLIMSE